jgi:hypothetical protein
MIRKHTCILNSPLGYEYKCVFIFNYANVSIKNKISGTFYIGNPKTKIDEACVTISVFFPSNNISQWQNGIYHLNQFQCIHFVQTN